MSSSATDPETTGAQPPANVTVKDGGDREREQFAGPESGPESPFPIKLQGPVIKGFGRGSKEVSCCPDFFSFFLVFEVFLQRSSFVGLGGLGESGLRVACPPCTIESEPDDVFVMVWISQRFSVNPTGRHCKLLWFLAILRCNVS